MNATAPVTALTKELAQGHPEPFEGLRKDALTILEAGLDAVQPGPLLANLVDDGVLQVGDSRYTLGEGDGLHILSVGRGAQGFARVAHEAFPQAEGLVIAPEPGDLPGWDWVVGEHPVPGEGSMEAGKAALAFAQDVPPGERLLVLLTGGASALMVAPRIPLDDLQLTTRTLLARGVTVHEMNLLRKRLSRLKGGQLAKACPGEVTTLLISDVPNDRPTDVGSGPTVPDPTTFQQADALVQRIGPTNLPPVVVDHIEEGMEGRIPETPKPGDEAVKGEVHVLATNRDAREAAEEMARELGHRVVTVPGPIEGEARVEGATLARRLVREEKGLIAGGEAVVRLRPEHEGGPGKGGRNQELVLATVEALAKEHAVVAGFGTDGLDGPTDAAGAIADGRTLERAKAQGLDIEAHLERNDAYAFFDAMGDLIRTGPTGTNAMDLVVGLTKEP